MNNSRRINKKESVKVAGVEIFKPDHYTAYA